MLRRLFWSALGAVAGALVTVWALAGARRARERLRIRPGDRAGRAGGRLREAIEEGRRAAAAYEARHRVG